MDDKYITDKIKYIGVDDESLDLFENQYILKNGMSYNSYLVDDEKIVIIDTVDKRKTNEWLDNLEKTLNGRNPDYLIISHLEPDHSGSIGKLINRYPNIKIISNEKVFSMLPQFIDNKEEIEQRKVVVKEGDTFSSGTHNFKFIMAPMVHWPEVMMTYEENNKILFSADAFGKFGTINTDEPWINEARRYYINIVGKYGMQVQMLLAKASKLDIKMICSLHGPILKENLQYYIDLYDKWSKYEPETNGTLIVCGSLHGNTLEAAQKFERDLKNDGEVTKLVDISRTSIPDVVSEAFKYSKMVIACATYNMSIFPAINSFLTLLKEKNYQNRKVGIIENGSWAPNAAKCITGYLECMKDIEIINPVVTIKTRLNEDSYNKLKELEDEIIKR